MSSCPITREGPVPPIGQGGGGVPAKVVFRDNGSHCSSVDLRSSTFQGTVGNRQQERRSLYRLRERNSCFSRPKQGEILLNKPRSLLKVDNEIHSLRGKFCHNRASSQSESRKAHFVNTKCQRVISLTENRTKESKWVVILSQSCSLFLPPAGILHLWLSSELFRHNVRNEGESSCRYIKLQKKDPQHFLYTYLMLRALVCLILYENGNSGS